VLRITLKDLFARKRRLATTGIAIVLGIAFLSGTQLLSAVLSDSIRSLIGDVYEGVDGVVRSPQTQDTGFGPPLRTPITESVAAKASTVDGVRAATGIVEATTVKLIGKDGKVVGSDFGPPTIVYNSVEDDQLSFGSITKGRLPETATEMVMGFGAAKEGKYSIGDSVSINTQDGTEKFTLVGLTGVGADGERDSGAKTLAFVTPTAQRLAKIPGEFNYVITAATKGTSQDQLATALAAAFPDEQVVTGEKFSEENQDQISQFVDILSTFVTVFGVIALIVACFIIYNTFSIVVAQRSRETALLRAVGARRRQVLLATLLEAVVVGFIASLLGLLGGVALATLLQAAVSTQFGVQDRLPQITLSVVITALVIGIGVTVLSAVVPAIRSTRIPPIAALSEVSLDRSDMSRSRLVWGTGMLVIGTILMALGLTETGPNPLWQVGGAALLILISVSLVLGPLIAAPVSRLLAKPFSAGGRMSGRLAGENAARNPKRTAATAAALTIGVTLVTVIAVLASSIKTSVDSTVRESLKADFIVNATGFSFGSGVPSNVADQITALPEVAISSPVRFSLARLTDDYGKAEAAKNPKKSEATAGIIGGSDSSPDGEDTFLLGIDPTTFFEVVDTGIAEGSPKDIVGDSIVTTAETATKRGWKLGDKIPVYFAQTGVQQLRLAMLTERKIGQSDLYIPLETFEPNVLPGFNIDNAIYVTAKSGASLPTLRKELDRLVADQPAVKVQDLNEYVASQTGPIDTFLNIVYALLGLAIIIALIGIANTLSLSILERTRELGLLRAVGMSRKQLRQTVRQEAAIIAVFGTLMGLVIGISFSIALSAVISTDNADVFTFNLPVGQLLIITIVAALAGIVAAIIPARRAARLDVLAAISSI